MTINNIQASFALSANVYPTGTGLSGSVPVSITEDLRYLNLDSAYVNVFANADLASLTKTFNTFPTVNLGGARVLGEDKQPLLLNGIHAIAIRCLKVNPALPALGYITVTLTKLGGATAATRSIVPGDSIFLTTSLGWPAQATTALAITGTSTLTNTQLVVALVGHTTVAGTGYSG